MNYYIGIDVGTTSVKAVAFNESGDIVGKESIEYPIDHPHSNYSEQNPDEILEAVVNALSRLSGSLSDHNPILVSFSAAMHSVMIVDAQCKPLTNLIIWADNRASVIAESFKETDLGKMFYRRTGVPVHAMSPFCKLLWLNQNNPTLFAAAYKFIGIKEYIFCKFSGKYVIDIGLASATGLLNINRLQWDEDILKYTGIKQLQLSTVVSNSHKEFISESSNYFDDKRCERLKSVAFIAGSSDGALANLGSHAVAENTMAVTIGTSAAVRVVCSEAVTDIYARTFCYYFDKDRYILGGASSNGGVVIQWLKDKLLLASDSYDALLEQSEKIVPGCNGLLFIPYVLGERAPVWNAHAKGVFFGLDITHNRAHLVRAAVEGVVYAVYSIGKILMENRTITEIYVTGGFTQNRFWVQILCDMFNCTVVVSGATEGSATGAVIIGLEAMGIKQSWQPQITATYSPDPALHSIYIRQFEKYERIYKALENEMNNGR